ncbi:MAG TPA: PcfJ domain-containing protein [Gemmatales bacterium]|nr:PcfJ domain-containing protein [Gemmatales bacterium]HMP59476.1 PcfJ domain-containing protein [Gemmatales bacterium]
MSTFRHPLVTDLSTGIRIAIPSPLVENDGEPDWLRELTHEYRAQFHPPVTITRQGCAFHLAFGSSFEKRFSLVDYCGLIRRTADYLMLKWFPPREVIDDELFDCGPDGFEEEEWLCGDRGEIRRTAVALNTLVHDRWQRLRDEADPTAIAAQRKVFSAACGYGQPELVMSPEFYKHKYIVKDVLAYRAAAAAAGITGRDATNEDGIAFALEWMAKWKAIFAPTGETYPILNKTLMNLPPGIPAQVLLDLNKFMLPRPITSRLELLTVIRAHKTGQRNIRAFSFATEAQIAEAMRRVSNHLHEDLSPRRWRDVNKAVLFLGDYPDSHHGNVVGLAERSIRWHRDHQDELAERVVVEFGNAKEVAMPPIPLPALEGVRFLATVGEVVQEGADMEHCIAKYATKAVSGHSFLFHVEYQGERASVEVDWYGHVVQACGPKNEDNVATEWGRKALEKWGRGLKKAAPTSTAGTNKFDLP